MIKKEVTVTNLLGIHARPASMIVKVATQFKSDINLIKDDVNSDAKSIMGVMMLAAAKDSTVGITAEGPDEQLAVEAIIELFENKFNEDPPE
jgi:phosphocarrier protein HPr